MKSGDAAKSELPPPTEPVAGTISYLRLGLVVTPVTTHRGDQLSREVMQRVLRGNTPKAIVERLAAEVRALGIEQFIDELDYIESRMKSQNYSYTGRHDPVYYAIQSLSRAMMIASTEQYYETLVKYNINAKSRAEALSKNRAAASRFPPDSEEERGLVRRFRALVDSRKDIKNIPSMLHADYSKAEDPPSLMSIRRTLQRLELLPAPKTRQTK